MSLETWMSPTQDDYVRNFVAFVADADQIEIALARRAELSWICFTRIGADRLAHAEEDCACAAIGFFDDDRVKRGRSCRNCFTCYLFKVEKTRQKNPFKDLCMFRTSVLHPRPKGDSTGAPCL